MERASVLVVDDHEGFAERLCGALERQEDFEVLGHAGSGAAALQACRVRAPDLVVMDCDLPDMDAVDVTAALVREVPGVRVVMLTPHTDLELVGRATTAGACGVLPKDGALSILLGALRSARLGRLGGPMLPTVPDSGAPTARRPAARVPLPQLTPREREVLELMGAGKDVRTIARTLAISPHTCRGYVKTLLVKLDAHSQLEAVLAAARLGLLNLSVGA